MFCFGNFAPHARGIEPGYDNLSIHATAWIDVPVRILVLSRRTTTDHMPSGHDKKIRIIISNNKTTAELLCGCARWTRASYGNPHHRLLVGTKERCRAHRATILGAQMCG